MVVNRIYNEMRYMVYEQRFGVYGYFKLGFEDINGVMVAVI